MIEIHTNEHITIKMGAMAIRHFDNPNGYVKQLPIFDLIALVISFGYLKNWIYLR